MKRPGYDLTWRSIHHQWSLNTNRIHTINKPTDIQFHTPNNITKVSKQPLSFLVGNEEQRLDPVSKITVGSVPTFQHEHDGHHSSNVSHECETNDIHSELRTIVSQLAIITNHICREERHENESQDWKFVAMVIDRLCLILFTVSMAIFSSLTLLSAPNFYSLQ
jgi:hypothetical protein